MAKLFKLNSDGASNEAFVNFYHLNTIQSGRASKDDGSKEYAEWRPKFDKAVPSVLSKLFTDFNDAVDIDGFVAERISDCLDQLGQNSPVVTVREYADGCCAPRAYESFPEIRIEQQTFGIAEKDKKEGIEYELRDGTYWYTVTDTYMSCPVGYDGSHFTPEGAELVDAAEQERLEEFWHDGWTGGPPTLHKYGQGVALPEGYKPSGEAKWIGQSINNGACFLVEGKALGILAGHLQKDASHKAAIDAVFGKIEEIVLNGRDEKDYVDLSFGADGFSFRLKRDGGEVIPKFNCPDIVIEAKNKEECLFKVLSGNCDTPAGQRLQSLIDAVDLERPKLKHNIEFAVNGTSHIRHDQYGDRHYLIYLFEGDEVPETIDVPEGMTRVPLQERNWLAETQNELDTRVPPPLPEHLAHLEPAVSDMASKTKRQEYVGADGLVFAF